MPKTINNQLKLLETRTPAAVPKKKKKRRVIEDSDSEEEDMSKNIHKTATGKEETNIESSECTNTKDLSVKQKKETPDSSKKRRRIIDSKEDEKDGVSGKVAEGKEQTDLKNTGDAVKLKSDDGSKKAKNAESKEHKTIPQPSSSPKKLSAFERRVEENRRLREKQKKEKDSSDAKEDGKVEKEKDDGKSYASLDDYNEEEEEEEEDDDVEEIKKEIKTVKLKAPPSKSKKATIATVSDKKILDSISWKGHLPYSAFCETMEKIEAVTGRLEIQSYLTTLFRQVLASSNPKDLYHLLYLSSNSVAPSYECIELGIGDAILIKAIGEAYGTNPSLVKQKYEAEGDLGTVAMASKGKQRTLNFGMKPKSLAANDVLEVFREIAKTTGAQSQKLKVDKIKKLLVRAQGSEAKYIIRGLQGKLRIGLARSTVLISLAHALCLTPPESVEEKKQGDNDEEVPKEAILYRKSSKTERLEAAVMIIKKAYSEVPSYDSLLDAGLSVPLDELHKACTLTPGIPVEPMLAKPTKSIQEVLKRLNGQRFTCEFKYDGERAQVHLLEDETHRVFSRNLLDTTEKYPEVPEYVKEACVDVTSFVLDTEVVAFNRETGNLVPFQVLSTRKKTEESAETAKVQVIVQAFDLMYLNGESLLNKTLAERRELMMKHFKSVENKFQFAKSLDHEEDGDTTVLEEFLDTAVKGQCEGLMVKTLDENAAYEPSKRSLNWLKLKKDYLEGLGDSVDLVPLGAYYGRGKRTGVYGAYLLACYDAESEEFQSVCKIGTGFSDENLKALTDSFKEHIVDTKPSNYNSSDTLDCDVWFEATQVWEVKAADLSKSSTHKGAIGRTGEAGRGIGLRFPRFERVRDDKNPERATSSDQILEMYYQQDSVVNDGGGDGFDDDDGI